MRLLTLEVPGQKVEIEFEGETVTAVSNDGGVIDAQVPLSSTPQAGMATALLRIPGRAPAKATIHVVDPAASRGVICDIDDTIWVTGLAHPLKAARRTLLSTSSSRRSVPGMAALLNEAVRDQDHPAVLYLSNGPWNLAGLASRFLRRDDFPAGPTLMTDWGITPRRWFRDGKEHKRSSIARLHKDFPHITWVLIGDDGEHDPQIYLDFARDHRDNVEVIVLREVDPTANRKPDPVTTTDGVPVLRGPDGNALLPLLRRSRQD
jgi:phosphatidate phosphatase APP1